MVCNVIAELNKSVSSVVTLSFSIFAFFFSQSRFSSVPLDWCLYSKLRFTSAIPFEWTLERATKVRNTLYCLLDVLQKMFSTGLCIDGLFFVCLFVRMSSSLNVTFSIILFLLLLLLFPLQLHYNLHFLFGVFPLIHYMQDIQQLHQSRKQM